MLVERGIYEIGNHGWNNNEIVLEKFDNHVVPNEYVRMGSDIFQD